MEMFVNFKYKKILLTLLIILTIPIWLTFFNYLFDFIIASGKITGTIIRVIGSKNVCLM